MPVFTDSERSFARALSKLVYCNPFLPERIGFERDALGADFVDQDMVWSIRPRIDRERPNIQLLQRGAESLVEQARQRLCERPASSGGRDGGGAREADLSLYQDLVRYVLYYRNVPFFTEMIAGSDGKRSEGPERPVRFYGRFVGDIEHFFGSAGLPAPTHPDPAQLFAGFFQIRRAFHNIYSFIVGTSLRSARLRAEIWQSVFTHDLRRYQRFLFERMGDFTTLITGESGTGKELVARAIAFSRYIPFDPKTKTFSDDPADSFHALNLSALSPTLIESELFGHRRGAFTGALEDRAGWLEVCKPLGTVFLDEIGETDGQIQVKLLRVLQMRSFQRLGDTATRHFHGKIIAATNRDLAAEMRNGRFRHDFYYRLCADMIETPSLREQLRESPGDLRNLILFITTRLAPDAAEELASETEAWIVEHLGQEYGWPGNFRELEQCVVNILIRKEYRPAHSDSDGAQDLADAIAAGSLTADALLRRYCTIVYGQTQNYEETARRLKLDRRTVKAKVESREDDKVTR
ncbi:MAG TPA: sigma 54-interacting transcriptional regulator [Tepidisphaeraceae bacterium]|jgi:transcriptional regulator with AAA-type ATPase domain